MQIKKDNINKGTRQDSTGQCAPADSITEDGAVAKIIPTRQASSGIAQKASLFGVPKIGDFMHIEHALLGRM